MITEFKKIIDKQIDTHVTFCMLFCKELEASNSICCQIEVSSAASLNSKHVILRFDKPISSTVNPRAIDLT